jgi:hypothetical protein
VGGGKKALLCGENTLKAANNLEEIEDVIKCRATDLQTNFGVAT